MQLYLIQCLDKFFNATNQLDVTTEAMLSFLGNICEEVT